MKMAPTKKIKRIFRRWDRQRRLNWMDYMRHQFFGRIWHESQRQGSYLLPSLGWDEPPDHKLRPEYLIDPPKPNFKKDRSRQEK